MHLIFILRGRINVKRLRLVLFEHFGLRLIDGLLNVHADDVLQILVNVVLDAELLGYLLRIVVFVDSQLLLLPVPYLNRDNEQLAGVLPVLRS